MSVLAQAARRAAVPALIGASLLAAAGPAAAADDTASVYAARAILTTGRLIVNGVYQCAGPASEAFISTSVYQHGPDDGVRGSDFRKVACTGATTAWHAYVVPRSGAFTPGEVHVLMSLWPVGQREDSARSAALLAVQ